MIMLRNGAIIAVAIYVAIVIAMYLMQRQLQYFPENKRLTPAAVGIGAEIIRLTTADQEQLVAWYSRAGDGKPTILYLHGNGGEIGDRPHRFQFYQANGFGVFYLSYRGYGGSTGSPSETGLITDARTAYDWLVAQGIAPQNIVLVGESLGSGVAVQLAAERRTSAVALEAPYTSTVDIGAAVYWWLPVRLLMKDRFESIKHIASINAPLLIVHGDADQIIPVESGRGLFEAAREPKQLIVVPGGGHETIFETATWMAEAKFFDRFTAQ
jgi:uncharacterized protein